MDALTPEIIQARRDYHREWRKNHPENVTAAQLRYWNKKAQRAEQQREGMSSPDPDAQTGEQGSD